MDRRETPANPTVKIITGHFSCLPGYRTWRRQGTRDWLLTLTLDGQGRYGHALGSFACGPGHLVLLRPGALHDYAIAPGRRRWEFLWAHFHPRPEWLELLRWPEEAPGLMRLDASRSPHLAAITSGLRAAHAHATGAQRRRDDLAMNALENALLWCDNANHRETAPLDARLQAAMDHCCRNLGERLTLGGLARISRLSPSRLSYLFQSQAGDSPMRYLERRRIGRAQELLETTSEPITAIAEQVGFDSACYFSLRFRRRTGMSPSAFRERARRRPDRRPRRLASGRFRGVPTPGV